MQSICTRENRHSHARVLPPPQQQPMSPSRCPRGVSGMYVCVPLLSRSFLEIPAPPLTHFPLAAPCSSPRRAEGSAAPAGTNTEWLLAADTRFTVYYSRDSQWTRIRPQPRRGIHNGQGPARQLSQGRPSCTWQAWHSHPRQDRHPRPSLLCCHQRFHHLLLQHSPFPQPSSSPSTQQCPSLLVCPQPSSRPRAKGYPSRWPIRATSRSRGRGAYPGGRASGAGTAARADAVLEPEASSASPALGRAGAPEPSAPLTGAGALATAAGLSSSLSAAPAVSPFTAKAEGRNVSTPKGLMNSTHAALAAEHTRGGSHCHRAQDQRCRQQWQQLPHPAARSLWNRCYSLHPGTKAEGTLRLCSVSPLPPANMLQA